MHFIADADDKRCNDAANEKSASKPEVADARSLQIAKSFLQHQCCGQGFDLFFRIRHHILKVAVFKFKIDAT